MLRQIVIDFVLVDGVLALFEQFSITQRGFLS